MLPSGLWSDDPAERRRRLAEALARHRARERAEAGWVVYLPADRFFVDPTVDAAARWACQAAARALGLPFVPEIRWFREGGAHDHLGDHPLAFKDRPGVAGYVQDGAPEVIWLSTRYCEPGAQVAPSLVNTVAHECEHARQQLAGLRGRTRGRERLADLMADALERGAPVPR